ncbi:choice-of-anchor J domain-containing protein [uncultured Bacteroides sp.]|uniref:choice-of-anchor J domain-containing protein n=1 Tax=uncultured Bacteroides sp. TaxID=162156 RepID=UPI002AAC0900|nr:choice-of-anchor J domain-containing protein [uncultured Bacteroides sp.]
MKKILFFSILLAGVSSLFTSCNNEPNFDGLDDLSKPTNLATYTDVYPGENFSADKLAKTVLPAWLLSKYYTCDEGSSASVTYNYETTEEDVPSISVDFERNIILNAETNISGWFNLATVGDLKWMDKSYNNVYTQMSANGAAGEVNAWFISPKHKVTKGESLSFDVCIGYWNADCLQVLISSTFQGTNSSVTNSKTKWIDVTSSFTIPQEPTNKYGSFATAGSLNLDQYAGQDIYVAFKYVGNGAAESKATTTIQLDNIKIAGTKTVTTEMTDEYSYDGAAWNFVRTVPKAALNETFDDRTINSGDKTMLTGWVSAATQGTVYWTDKSYSKNNYTNCSAYKQASTVEAWLITPELEIRDNYILKFDMVSGHWTHEALHVYVSTNFDGKEEGISTATWEEITDLVMPKKESGYSSFTTVGPTDLSAYVGQNIYVAFKYLGDPTQNQTSTVQLDNIYVGE